MTSPRPLRVLTFNIRQGLAPDGSDAWPFRRGAVAEAVIRSGADVLCLQEVHGFQDWFLRRRLVGYGSWSRPRGRRFGERLPVAWNRSRLRLQDRGVFWLSRHPDRAGSRGWDAASDRICTWMVLFDQVWGPFAVFNLHLDNRGRESRIHGARLVVRTAERLASMPRLICGDMNAGEDMPPIRAFREAGFRDTFRDVHPEADARTFHRMDGRPRYTKLDYVLADSSWTTVDAGIDRRPVGARWPSDHFPVTADLTLETRYLI